MLYRQAEMVSALAWKLLDCAYPMESLTEGWKLVLLNQFHDIIPGSSIHAVYEDCQTDYAQAKAIGQEAQRQALAALAGAVAMEADGVIVWNALSWTRSGLLEVTLPEAKAGATVEGVPCTRVQSASGETLCFLAQDVPAMGYRSYRLVHDAVLVEPAVKASASRLENDVLRVVFDQQGRIVSIWDKEARREVLRAGGFGNRLTIYEDKPERESAWNIDVEYRNKFWHLDEAVSIRVVECSAVQGVLEIVRMFHKSTITQRVMLRPGSRCMYFETHVDWQETEKMLKAAFEVDVLSSKAAYEIAYGAIERPTHTNTLWDQAKFEVPAHKWADLSEGGYGVALLNDCKYGYSIHDHTMALTLLRSPVYPDPTADKGSHDFTYALLPHMGDWRAADVTRAGYELNVPLLGLASDAHTGTLPPTASALTVDSPSAVVETLKMSQDGNGLILRVYESKGIRQTMSIRPQFPVSQVYETNLMEEREREVSLGEQGFESALAPYEIKTFRLV
jgi:alpha-mannosidase